MTGARGFGNIRSLWPSTLAEAKTLQSRLREMVRTSPLRKPPAYVGAVDAAFAGDVVVAVACLYSFPSLEHREDAVCREALRFPYVAGYLTFREGHASVAAIKRLKTAPDVILVDGHGIAHPRGIGIASHIGVILEIPTIGCAKSRLVGSFDEPPAEKGSRSDLLLDGASVGAVLRTRTDVNPVFVSPGHMTDIPLSVEIVMKCVSRYRMPDPLRRADMLSRKLSREEGLRYGSPWAESRH